MHMTHAPEYAHHEALARDCARAVCDVFDEYHVRFRATARRAARHFRTRDWVAVREESVDRLRLYGRSVDHAIAQVVRRARDVTNDRRLWVAMREQYAALIETRL